MEQWWKSDCFSKNFYFNFLPVSRLICVLTGGHNSASFCASVPPPSPLPALCPWIALTTTDQSTSDHHPPPADQNQPHTSRTDIYALHWPHCLFETFSLFRLILEVFQTEISSYVLDWRAAAHINWRGTHSDHVDRKICFLRVTSKVL